MSGSDEETRPISVAELLARNGTLGAPPVSRRRRKRNKGEARTVAELTGEIPILTPVTEVKPVVRAPEAVTTAPAPVEPAPEPAEPAPETAELVAEPAEPVAEPAVEPVDEAPAEIAPEDTADTATQTVVEEAAETAEDTHQDAAPAVADADRNGQVPAPQTAEEADYEAHIRQRDDDIESLRHGPRRRPSFFRKPRLPERPSTPEPVAAPETNGTAEAIHSAETTSAVEPAGTIGTAETEAAAINATAETVSPPEAISSAETVTLGVVDDESDAEHMTFDPVEEAEADPSHEDLAQLAAIKAVSVKPPTEPEPVSTPTTGAALLGAPPMPDLATRQGVGPATAAGKSDLDLVGQFLGDRDLTTRDHSPKPAAGAPRRQAVRNTLWAVGQCFLSVAFGAGLFFAFDQLWRWSNVVAFVLSVLVILGLVVGVRVVRKAEDFTSTMIAVLVGALVTLGPLVLHLPAS
jgi:hypothetical protein